MAFSPVRELPRRRGFPFVPTIFLVVFLAFLTAGWLTSRLSTQPVALEQITVAAAVEARTDAAASDFAEPPASPLLQWGRFVLVGSDEWDAATRQSLHEALTVLPASVRSELGNPSLGPLFVLVNTDGMTLSGRQPYGRGANFYSTNEGRNELVLYPGQSAGTALHELGHSYNLRRTPPGAYAQVFLDPEMLSFLKATGWRLLTPSNELRGLKDHTKVELSYTGAEIWTQLSRNDPLEDYANSFALYFSAPEELRALSPARYGWFDARFGP
ncbi:MAG TPA: hypothetical protein VG845_14385 [Dehalococcoidia bacterium]|jgi:hypothetical protein|nr:hypothetical protein [Dehalococcoidia bacterium]